MMTRRKLMLTDTQIRYQDVIDNTDTQIRYQDMIDNAVYTFLCKVAQRDLPWDIEQIGIVRDALFKAMPELPAYPEIEEERSPKMITCPECGSAEDLATVESCVGYALIDHVEDNGTIIHTGRTVYGDQKTRMSESGKTELYCLRCDVNWFAVLVEEPQ